MIRKYQYGGSGYFLDGVTAKDLDEGTKKVARGFNQLMGKVGDAFNLLLQLEHLLTLVKLLHLLRWTEKLQQREENNLDKRLKKQQKKIQ